MKFVALISLIALVSLVIVVIRVRSKRRGTGSFWDAVRNPNSVHEFRQLLKSMHGSLSAISGSEAKTRKLVDSFVFKAKSTQEEWREKKILGSLAEQAYPRALQLLRDPSMHERLLVPTCNEESIQQAPICRLADIFDLHAPPPPEAADLLAPFFNSESAEIRNHVALIVGSVGSSQLHPVLRQALKDEHEYVKSFALMGIHRALTADRIPQSAKAQYYKRVAEIWPQDTSFSINSDIPRILLQLDRDRAVDHLLQPDLLTAKFEPVWRILEAFDEASIAIPRPKLLALIEEAGGEPLEYPMGYVLGNALALLGQHRSEEDLPLLERSVEHPHEQVHRGAIKGLEAYHRFSELMREPWDVVMADGWAALTLDEKHICAVDELHGEVNNGGFAQYFFNPSGDHWQDALNGLAAIGATRRHGIMAATLEQFAGSAPSSDRATRTSHLSKIARKQDDPFNEQDTAWYKPDDQPLERLMFRYKLNSMMN